MCGSRPLPTEQGFAPMTPLNNDDCNYSKNRNEKGRPSPLKPMMHIEFHIFHKIYKFPTYFPKTYKFPPVLRSINAFLPNLLFFSSPIFTIYASCFTGTGRPWKRSLLT